MRIKTTVFFVPGIIDTETKTFEAIGIKCPIIKRDDIKPSNPNCFEVWGQEDGKVFFFIEKDKEGNIYVDVGIDKSIAPRFFKNNKGEVWMG